MALPVKLRGGRGDGGAARWRWRVRRRRRHFAVRSGYLTCCRGDCCAGAGAGAGRPGTACTVTNGLSSAWIRPGVSEQPGVKIGYIRLNESGTDLLLSCDSISIRLQVPLILLLRLQRLPCQNFCPDLDYRRAFTCCRGDCCVGAGAGAASRRR